MSCHFQLLLSLKCHHICLFSCIQFLSCTSVCPMKCLSHYTVFPVPGIRFCYFLKTQKRKKTKNKVHIYLLFIQSCSPNFANMSHNWVINCGRIWILSLPKTTCWLDNAPKVVMCSTVPGCMHILADKCIFANWFCVSNWRKCCHRTTSVNIICL